MFITLFSYFSTAACKYERKQVKIDGKSTVENVLGQTSTDQFEMREAKRKGRVTTRSLKTAFFQKRIRNRKIHFPREHFPFGRAALARTRKISS
jgi:hypothetical protein